MVWVESPKFFCAFSETLTDVAITLVDTELPVPSYGATYKIPATGPPSPLPPHTNESLNHINCYMDDVIYLVQGRADHQHRVFDITGHALKWLFSSLPGESK